jgi:hypothetical protein
MAIQIRRAVLAMAVIGLVLGLTPYQAEQSSVSNPFLSKAPGAASSASSTSWAPPREIQPPEIRKSEYNLESPPLRKVMPVANRKTKGVAGTSLPKLQRSTSGGDERALQQDPLPFPDQNFNGVPNSTGIAPPDTSGEAGINHYVQGTNSGFAVFNKNSGQIVAGPADISVLWQGVGDECETQGRGDPVIQYDQLAQRWLITQFAFPLADGQPVGPYFECVAVSTTADPLGTYYLYSVRMHDTIFPDYPHFGVWPDGYYLTVHLFENGQFAALGVIVFDREEMLQGAPARAQVQILDSGYYGMLPADLDGATPPPTGSPMILVALNDARDQIELYQYAVNWVDRSATQLLGPAVLQTGPWDGNMCGGSRDCIPQPNTPTRLDPAANQSVMYRAAYRNFGNRESLLINHTVDADGADLAGIRWYEIGSLQANPALIQGNTFSPDGLHRWMGSIASDRSGNIAIGYSGSHQTEFPSIRYTGRLVSDPQDLMARGEIFLSGNGSQTGVNRWGDYAHMSVDPQDDCTFWYTNEYYPQTSERAWRTAVISFRFPSCDPTLPPAPDNTPPQVGNVRDAPDPFRRNTRIEWTLTERATVDVAIFKRSGALVRLLVARNVLNPGDWFAKWNGRNKAGVKVAPGRYEYTIDARDAAGNVRREGGVVKLIR